MKNTIILSLITSVVFVFFSCNDHNEDRSANREVRFLFQPAGTVAPNGRVESIELPPASSLIVTLENSAGVRVHDHLRIDILKVGLSYMTVPISLSAGSYKIVDFMVANTDDEVIYATPRHGSPMADIVTNPLPFTFYVGKNSIADVSMEVVDVRSASPEDFGYASFHIALKAGIPFSMALLVQDDDRFIFSDGELIVLQGNDTIQRNVLQAKVNALLFTGDPAETYTFVVFKRGFLIESTTQSFESLLNAISGDPWTVRLFPAFTMIGQGVVQMVLKRSQTEIIPPLVVDWGDGTQETILNNDEFLWIDHSYNDPTKHHISIYGDDLSHIEEIGDLQGVLEIELMHLPNLKRFSEGYEGTLKSLDVSDNKKLTGVELRSDIVTSINIIGASSLRSIYLEETPGITTGAIDQLINDIYANATQYGITNGSFGYTRDAYGRAAGPPSLASFAVMAKLQQEFQWNAFPTYNYILELFYEDDSISGGLYPGAFTVLDYATMELLPLQEYIINFQNGYDGWPRVVPTRRTYNGCESIWNGDSYLGPLHIIDVTTTVDLSSLPYKLHVTMTQSGARTPRFESECQSTNGESINHPISLTFDLNFETQTTVVDNGRITAVLTSVYQ